MPLFRSISSKLRQQQRKEEQAAQQKGLAKMALEEEEELEPTKTDIFQQQKKTIDTLVQVLAEQGVAQPEPLLPQQIVYAAPAEPAKAPSYLTYLAVGVLAILFFKK